MNIFISVVSDAYEEFQMTMEEEDYRWKARLLLLTRFGLYSPIVSPRCEEWGHIYIWRVKQKDEVWTGRVNEVKNAIKRVEKGMKDGIQKVEKEMQRIEND